MKQRKKLLAALLVVVAVCGACFGAAGAAPGSSRPFMLAAQESSQLSALAAAAAGTAFADVPAGAWYAEAANWCLSQGILTGNELSPDAAMTRATVSDALYRAEGSPAV